MNNKQLTESNNSIPYKDIDPTSITPTPLPDDVTYEDVVKIISKYLTSEHNTFEDNFFIKKGAAKSLPKALKISTVIQNITRIIVDSVQANNDNISLKDSQILSSCISSIDKSSDIIDNLDVDVAYDQLLCYLLGYMIKLLKNHKTFIAKI
jgi:hypothetical protein